MRIKFDEEPNYDLSSPVEKVIKILKDIKDALP
jgi:hypothetical protein